MPVAQFEMTWTLDDRSRAYTPLRDMPGLFNSVVLSRTAEGNQGTAGVWDTANKVAGINSHSPPMGEPRHTAPMAIVNVTFVNYTGGQFVALEACGKCKVQQGGATASMAGIKFVQEGFPALSTWSWSHQVGVREHETGLAGFLDFCWVYWVPY